MGPKPPKPTNHTASPRFKRPKTPPAEPPHKRTLQDLMRELPNEMGQALKLIMLDGPDRERSFAHRTAALVGSSFLDHALQEAISLNFDQISNTLLRELFDDRAPLSSLDAKIKMARALRIITNKQRQNLDTIRRIRNTFAHSKIDLVFEIKEIADECYKLTN